MVARGLLVTVVALVGVALHGVSTHLELLKTLDRRGYTEIAVDVENPFAFAFRGHKVSGVACEGRYERTPFGFPVKSRLPRTPP